MWKAFLKEEINESDPFLRAVDDQEKTSLIGLLMLRRHEAGHRGKAATAFTAGIRMHFTEETLPTAFLDAAVIATSRVACKLKPSELREKRDGGLSSTTKLPVCESILEEMRARLWEGRSWSDSDIVQKMTYVGCMWAFEFSARVSEYTQPEPGAQDHCVRTDDLTFTINTPEGIVSVVGSSLAGLDLSPNGPSASTVLECRMLAASTKNKVATTAKLLGRRSPAEAQFLDDIIEFIVNAGARGNEGLFSCRRSSGSRATLKASTVREALKETCRLHGLPPDFFSSHSFRKGAITHMRAQGASEDDRRDRGSYAPGSQVMNSTYDYAVGLGPLASNSLQGGYKPTLDHVKRLIPAVRQA